MSITGVFVLGLIWNGVVMGTYSPPYRRGKEVVFLRDLVLDQDRRHLEAGLPSYLEFIVVKRKSDPVRLKLSENKRLNANAPVFEVEADGDGGHRLIEHKARQITKTKFYHDKEKGGAFQVTCMVLSLGPCRRVITGNFHIDDRNFDIEPLVSLSNGTRDFTRRYGNVRIDETAHVLVENEVFKINEMSDGIYPLGARGVPVSKIGDDSDYKLRPKEPAAKRGSNARPVSGSMVRPASRSDERPADRPTPHLGEEPVARPASRPDERPADRPAPHLGEEPVARPSSRPDERPADRPAPHLGEEPSVRPVAASDDGLGANSLDEHQKREESALLVKLKDLLAKVKLLKMSERLLEREKRQTRQTYALEILVVIDPALWKKYYDRTSASDGMTRDETTEFLLRQRYVHIINGMSLRYESIEDPDMDIFLALSGFIFYKKIDETNPLPPSVPIRVVNGTNYADSNVYLESLVPWAENLGDLPHNDHVMVFTGYELHVNGEKAVAGQAYVGGVCNRYRVSINEDLDYFITISVATHELGHNLGADHDGSEKARACRSQLQNIMAPVVASFSPGEQYSINPWRFSPCSVEAFKTYVNSLDVNCLLDKADLYNVSEYNQHMSLLPGERHSPDKQCKLIKGDSSRVCTDITSEEICRVMGCESEGWCQIYGAAMGTPCGNPDDNKWCMYGNCVRRQAARATTTITPPSRATRPLSTTRTPNPTETPAPKTTKTSMKTTKRITTKAPVMKTTLTPTTATTLNPPPEDCVDIHPMCKDILQYYSSLETFCESFGNECCQTCFEMSEMEESVCIDSPMYECRDKIRTIGYSMCEQYGEKCCETCSSIESAGHLSHCDMLCSQFDSHEEFCKVYTSECYEMCRSNSDEFDENSHSTEFEEESHSNEDEVCVDQIDTCGEELKGYKKMKRFCKKNHYGGKCCRTCSKFEYSPCVDESFCQYTLTNYDSDEEFCGDWDQWCCATCKKVSIEPTRPPCVNANNCRQLRRRYRKDKKTFCQKYGEQCCKMCK